MGNYKLFPSSAIVLLNIGQVDLLLTSYLLHGAGGNAFVFYPHFPDIIKVNVSEHTLHPVQTFSKLISKKSFLQLRRYIILKHFRSAYQDGHSWLHALHPEMLKILLGFHLTSSHCQK
jgi:hypothetical protein